MVIYSGVNLLQWAMPRAKCTRVGSGLLESLTFLWSHRLNCRLRRQSITTPGVMGLLVCWFFCLFVIAVGICLTKRNLRSELWGTRAYKHTHQCRLYGQSQTQAGWHHTITYKKTEMRVYTNGSKYFRIMYDPGFLLFRIMNLFCQAFLLFLKLETLAIDNICFFSSTNFRWFRDYSNVTGRLLY